MLRASASLIALAMLVMAAVPVHAQSVIPVIVLTVAPVEQVVNVTGSPVDASFDCTVFVEGLPLVRYRVDLAAYCEGWAAWCDPAQFTVTGMANESFRARVTVPAGTPSTMQHQLEVLANVSTTGVPLNSSTAYALVSVYPVYGLKLRTAQRYLVVKVLAFQPCHDLACLDHFPFIHHALGNPSGDLEAHLHRSYLDIARDAELPLPVT